MRYWLIKSEPDVYSFADLERDGRTYWDGVRNYQARNTLRDDMKVGDLALYYHSNAEPTGIVGYCRVVREGYPDHTQFDSGATRTSTTPASKKIRAGTWSTSSRSPPFPRS